MPLSKVEITSEDMQIPQVLDQYYFFLKNTVGNSTGPLLLFNTITPFDIYEDTPFYNENVFRRYSELVVSRSPLKIDPSTGTSLKDGFTKYYTQLVTLSARQVDKKYLSPAEQTEIADLENDIESIRDKIDFLEEKLIDRWEKHYTKLGLSPNTLAYDLEKINYYNGSGITTQIESLSTDILSKLSDISRIKESTVPAEHHIIIGIENIIRSKEYKMYRPPRPNLEREGNVPYLEWAKLFANAKLVVNLKDLVEEGENILPFSALSGIFKPGARGVEISKSNSKVENHDVDWSVSGSGKAFGVFKGSASASYVKKIEQSFTAAQSLAINFQNIDEFYVTRREWFDESLFDNKIVQDVLSKNPIIARNTRSVVTSLVIGRGLSLKFTFSSTSHYQEMTDFKSSVSGGGTLGFVSFGGKGSYHKYDFVQENSAATNSITFLDGDETCRILAVRVSDLHSIGDTRAYEQSFLLESDFVELEKTLGK